MQLYLPLAEMPLNIFILLGLGLVVGFVAGLFGVGGGFLLTPLLILIGIPPAIAVGSVTAQIAAASFSGALAYHQRKKIDLFLGLFLSFGSLLGSLFGVLLFRFLNQQGHLDFVIALGFVLLLGFIGVSLLKETVLLFLAQRRGALPPLKKRKQQSFMMALPFKVRFKQSKLYISVLPILAIGLVIGLLGAVLGIGGGFLLVPMLIYILRVPSDKVVGTTLLITLITMSLTILFQAVFTQTVDVMLALPLIVGGVIGAQFGARLGFVLRGEWLRFLLGILLIGVAGHFLLGLIVTPVEPFSWQILR